MPRRLARWIFVIFCGAIAAALGIATATLYTPPGHALLLRLVADQADELVRGSVTIGRVGGTWVGGLSLDQVVIKDSTGALLADVPHLEVKYRLRDLLGKRILIASARLDQPSIQIIKHRNGRLNYQDIFKLNEGPPGKPSASPLVEIRDLAINGGNITIRQPWTPDGRITNLRQVDSALTVERAKPGRRIEDGPEGLELIRTLSNVDARLPLLHIASPKDDMVAVEIARLAARISDPQLDIRDLSASLRTKNDSLIFTANRVVLPGSELSGAGRVDWPSDTMLYHFALEAPKLALADIRFISPGFPDYRGSAKVQANSVSRLRTEYDIRELDIGDSTARIRGRLVALTDVYQGLGFRRLGLDLSEVNIDAVRPYLDSIPFYGTLSGRLGADGFFPAMTVSLDWTFADAKVPGATSRLGLDGLLHLGGADGMNFAGARLSNTDVDLRTVRMVSPAVILEGRLRPAGTLTGPWKNVVFDGTAMHQDDGRPQSKLTGKVRLDTRGAVLGLETDVVLDSLSFDGIRRTFPTLEAKGALGGRVRLNGMLDRLAVDADVGGRIGRVKALGFVTMQPPRWGADSLSLTFSALDLAALVSTAPPTQLQGALQASGVIDSARAPVGRLAVRLDSGRIRELSLDSARVVVVAADSMLTFQQLHAGVQGATLSGSGAIGWAPPKTGKLVLHADARDLTPFDSLALALTGFTRDSAAGDVVLTGKAAGDVTLEGAIGALRLDGTVVGDSLRWLGYRARNLRTHVAMVLPDSVTGASVSADSLGAGRLMLVGLQAAATGRPDNLGWTFATYTRDSTHLTAGGRYAVRNDARVVRADSLNLDLLGRSWQLAGPMNAMIRDSVVTLDTVKFKTRDGSGSIELAGSVSRGAEADLSVTALGIYLHDVYGLLQKDTTGIAGTLAVDARLSGTANAPELRGTGSLTGGVFGDFQAPLVRTAYDYRNHLLRSNLTFWRTGVPVVDVDASLPLDLALGKVAKRQLPGPLHIVARGDSVDLAIAEAFTPNLRQVTGFLNVDVRVEGTWDAPRLDGKTEVLEGAMDVPGLGLRYGPITGALRFAGDSIRADSVHVRGRSGDLVVTGGLRLQKLTEPNLNLTLSATQFQLINVIDYLKLEAWGDVTLTGPLAHPVLTGEGRLTNSVIYFSDLISKDIVNLEDPMNADLVDSTAIRAQGLGANFQSRFLDSLAIRDLDFIVGEAVWLRSNEANFQLEGRLRVNKNRKLYRIDGNLNTPRGTYTLAMGPIFRTFTVERGSVRYFGDLNAELDVQARHVVNTTQSGLNEVPIIAHITGTLEVPKLALTTPPDREPIPEPELISLLVSGTTNISSFNQQQQAAGSPAVGVVTTYFLGALSSEVQRALISGSGKGLDIVEIRPGLSSAGLVGTAASATQFTVGSSLTNKLFVLANAGFCFGGNTQNAFSPRNLGASLEYRFRRELKLVVSAEPLQTCVPTGGDNFPSRRYQFGAELRWDRDY